MSRAALTHPPLTIGIVLASALCTVFQCLFHPLGNVLKGNPVQLGGGLPNCLPWQWHHCTSPPALHEGFSTLTSLAPCLLIAILEEIKLYFKFLTYSHPLLFGGQLGSAWSLTQGLSHTLEAPCYQVIPSAPKSFF